MAVTGVGIDVVSISRFDRAVARWGARFTSRVFTEGELKDCRRRPSPSQHLSARFAAKEAVVKAMGTGFREGCRMNDIEIAPDVHGRPLVRLHGATGRLAAERGIEDIFLSLSHTGDIAVAQAVAVGKAESEEADHAVS